MRLRFRLRTYLACVAILALSLGYVVEVWRHGGFVFQYYHSRLAHYHGESAGALRLELEWALKHESHSTRCPECPGWGPPRMDVKTYIKERKKKIDEHEYYAWLHQLLAGPVVVRGELVY